ncbi:MAG: DUF386 domain-containing protein [Lachnospiraceae bacterium]|nr:DUF386 domain-containing protein [Lachnospiraceae bacterium]
MIYDKIENAKRYLGISKNLDTALHYIMDTDLSALEDGRHIVDSENVFVNVMQAVTKAGNCEYEFHEKYYDIQIDLEGAEDIRFATEYQEITKPYNEAADIGMGLARCEAVCHMEPGRFVICEPTEPHLPGIAVEDVEKPIRKAVVKVHR